MVMPYDWMRIQANGPLPPASMVGQASPYFRYLPNSGVVGPASAFPQAQAIAAGQAAQQAAGSAPGELASGLARAAAQPTMRALPAGAQAIPMGPASTPLVARAAAAAPTMGPGMVGVPMVAAEAPMTAAAARAAAPGLLGSARNALMAGGTRGLLTRAGRGAGVGLLGSVGGGMLDESSLLGGSESVANDATSKVLKWGSAGAGVGTLFGPGPGTAIGAGIGGLIGLGHEFLERQGVLKAPTLQEQVDTTIHEADAAARDIGVPSEVVDALKAQYRAEARFLEPDDKAGRTALAQAYADNLQAETVAFASDPAAYQKEATSEQGFGGSPERQMMMQALMVNAIKPYADQYMAQSEATAQSLENMAGQAGPLAPLYQQYAAQQRQMGTMYAGNLIQSAQITPYQQAAEQQAAYLKQIANQTMSQAIGQVMSPQQPAAGSTDLTAIIDQATNQLQPQ